MTASMLDLVFNASAWASLLTLTVMEIVLGIDNLVFISVLTSRLPTEAARKARALGLSMALVFRVLLLITLSWLIGLTAPVFSLFGHDFSWRDLILLAGGLFLLYKATHEIHAGIEGEEDESGNVVHAAFGATVAQIIAIDIVFSIDSIITAIGMAEHVPVMILAVVIAMIIMGAADTVSVVIRLSLVQLATPDDMRGRVGAVNFLFINASNQLGQFESGVTAALLGTVPAAVLGGVGTVAIALLWMKLFPSLRKVERLE